jgi:hypothetical protein
VLTNQRVAPVDTAGYAALSAQQQLLLLLPLMTPAAAAAAYFLAFCSFST